MIKSPPEAKVAINNLLIISNTVNVYHFHHMTQNLLLNKKVIKFLLEKYLLLFCLQWQTKVQITCRVRVFNFKSYIIFQENHLIPSTFVLINIAKIKLTLHRSVSYYDLYPWHDLLFLSIALKTKNKRHYIIFLNLLCR